ncbi:hypothetical protein BGZ90_007354 [Linnemannia elongata]|nr:hypothetical protein BGZ90_007354 [Linnemannia elongata]
MNSLTTGAAIAIGAITLPMTIPLVLGAAGSACAVLQSIGAVGLGVAGNLIAGIVGGAVLANATSVQLLILFAIIIDDTTADASPLEIEASKTVGRLKDLVLTKSPHTPCAISTLANSDSGACRSPSRVFGTMTMSCIWIGCGE